MFTFNYRSIVAFTIFIFIGSSFIQYTSALPSLRSDMRSASQEVLKSTTRVVSTISSKKSSSPTSKPAPKITANINPTAGPITSTFKTGNVVSFSQTTGYATMNLAAPNLSLAQCKAQCDGTEYKISYNYFVTLTILLTCKTVALPNCIMIFYLNTPIPRCLW